MGSGKEPLPSTVLKILLPQTRHRGPGAISDLNHGIEPNDPSGLSNPVVQFVVLIPQEPFVVAADPVEDGTRESPQIHRVGGPGFASNAIPRITCPEPRRHCRGDRLLDLRLALGPLHCELRAAGEASFPPDFPVRVDPAQDEFCLIVVPDTQRYAAYFPEIFRTQFQWIRAAVAPLYVKFVIHVGDVVEEGRDDEWVVADQAFALLAAWWLDQQPPAAALVGLGVILAGMSLVILSNRAPVEAVVEPPVD